MQFDDPQSQFDHSTFSAEPPRRGWFARNWLWFIPVVVVLPILICIGCCTGLMTLGVGALKTSEPYQQALAAVQEDANVQEALGTPIEDATFIPTGEINITNNQGDARFDFKVKGPKGRAHVRTECRMVDGVWSIVELIVTVEETGQRILLDTFDPDADDAPPLWNPEQG